MAPNPRVRKVMARVEECLRRWALRLDGEPFDDAQFAHVVPVRTIDDGAAVLKLQVPHREAAHEAAALQQWSGVGAARLLAHDADRHALLLERCRPGTHLSTLDADAALDVFASLLPRLAVEPPDDHPFATLADEAAHLADALPRRYERAGRPFDRRLLDAALDWLTGLPADAAPTPVLLSQDLHAGNVLAAEREPWLAIDPKPLVGDPTFAAVPALRGPELGHSRAAVLHRLDRLSSDLELDRERLRAWTIAHTIAWAFDDDGAVLRRHVDTAAWLLEYA